MENIRPIKKKRQEVVTWSKRYDVSRLPSIGTFSVSTGWVPISAKPSNQQRIIKRRTI